MNLKNISEKVLYYLGTHTGLTGFSSTSSSGWHFRGNVLVFCKVNRISFIAASTSFDFSPAMHLWGAGAGGGGVLSKMLRSNLNFFIGNVRRILIITVIHTYMISAGERMVFRETAYRTVY